MGKTVKKWKLVLILLVLSIAPVEGPGLSVAPVLAGDPGTSVLMDEVIVTASRDQQQISRVPANVTVITAAEIEKSGAASVVEVLEKLEGVHFRSYSGNPTQALIDLRGFGGDNPYGKTLILLDGRRLNRPDMNSVNWLQIPLHNVERIEIVRGAGSVLYGDAAIGGTINVITKKGLGKPRIEASATAGSYGFHDEKLGLSGSQGKLTYALTGENQKSFGYRERSKFSSQGAGLNLGYQAGDITNATLGLSFLKTDFAMPGALTMAEMAQNPKQHQPGNANDDATETYGNANLKIETDLGTLGRLDLDLLYGSKDIESNYESYWAPNRFNRYDIDTVGVTPRYILERSIGGHANKVIAGLDWYRETLTLKKYGDRERSVQTHEVDLEKNSLGIYIRDEFNILPELILTAGYRTERATIQATQTTLSPWTVDFDSEKIHKGEAAEVGLTYLLMGKSKLFARFSTVYRYPFLDEQASYYVGGAFNTNIEKETGMSYEIGTRIYPFKDIEAGLTLYRIDMEDEISADPVTWALKNLDKTRHEGLELSLSWKAFTWLDLTGNLTWQRATFTDGTNKDREVPMVPNLMANVGLEIRMPLAMVLRPEMRYVGEAYLANDYDNNVEKLQSYQIYSLFLLFRPGQGPLSAFLGIENLTDEKYALWGIDRAPWLPAAYSPAAGRTLKGGISLTF